MFVQASYRIELPACIYGLAGVVGFAEVTAKPNPLRRSADVESWRFCAIPYSPLRTCSLV